MIHSCNHWRNEVKVGPYKVLASSYHAISGKRLKVESSLVPTLGIYLDEGWNNVDTGYPKLIVDRPDCGIIALPDLRSLEQTIKNNLLAGETLGIACYLGHGRTGTLLACLIADIENLAPDLAIKKLRHRYCSYVVEYEEQVELVYSFCGKASDRQDIGPKGSLDIRL